MLGGQLGVLLLRDPHELPDRSGEPAQENARDQQGNGELQKREPLLMGFHHGKTSVTSVLELREVVS